ncbi:ribonuclease J [Butyrivibrio sp. CB08]|uniref:ribonuclease J n=1 Tax=Butyrivibrio sp. CB08 TaxID=2364879 RepID=UPI000EA99456|nr:ribonuclease J [Butyrivibrio sp. CB08]RKM57818.1 ribonuclease J [Butyrivibrio sp. CB08]
MALLHGSTSEAGSKIYVAENIKIIPLGGFDKIGMNMTLIESEDSIIAIDCGMSFPPDNMPGVSSVIPDVSYIKDNIDRFKGFVLTHGHEDHIGALPYVISDLKVPVYGTPLTIAMVEKKFRDFGIKGIKTKAIKTGNTIVVGGFKVEFIKTDHSIPDSAMLAIYTAQGTIINTGDFKFDMTPVVGTSTDLSRLSAIGSKGVLALLSDSTNASMEGFSRSEYYVHEQLDRFFNKYKENRLIIITFATNIDRVQQIINLGKKYGRKIVLDGQLLLDVFSIAKKLGYVDAYEDVLIDADSINDYRDGEVIFLTTGNHGESVQAISEIASGSHSFIKIKDGDVVLFSSVAIQGYEVEFNRTLNNLEESGTRVEFQDLHATGHACSGELKLLFNMLHPKFVIPAHGDYRFRREAKKIAAEVGISSDNIFLIDNGDIVEVSQDSCKVTGRVPLEEILIDGYEKRSIDKAIIRDRQQLSESGIVVAEVCVDKNSGRLASGIKLTSRGFLDHEKFDELSKDLEKVISKELSRFIGQGVTDERVTQGISEVTKKFIAEKSGKTPVVIALITEVMI